MQGPSSSGIPPVPVRARCSCGTRCTLPVGDALPELRAALAGVIEPSRPVLTYICPVCEGVVILRAEDLFLAVTPEAEQTTGQRRTAAVRR